jgi:hypothetical protein
MFYLKTERMKRIISLAFVFILISCMSQLYAQPKGLGVKGGFNFATIYGEDVEEDLDLKIGYHIGFSYDIPLGKILGIQTGVQYSTKGYGYSGHDSWMGGDYELTFTSTYLDIPLLLRLSILPLIDLYAGPQASYLLDSKYVVKAGGHEDSESGTEGMTKLDMALTLGVGFRSSKGLTAGLFLDTGLNSLDEDGDWAAYNAVLKLSLYYRF